jgi:hypothetical protein
MNGVEAAATGAAVGRLAVYRCLAHCGDDVRTVRQSITKLLHYSKTSRSKARKGQLGLWNDSTQLQCLHWTYRQRLRAVSWITSRNMIHEKEIF